MRNSRQISGMVYSVITLTCLFALMNGCVKQETEQRVITNISDIISPDAKPEIVIDGTQEETLLVRTEGPAWMNGKLYFSNKYIMGQSTTREGIWVVSPDRSYSVLDTFPKTFGIIPLNTGNLAACHAFFPTETEPLRSGVVEITPDGEQVRILADSYNGIPLGAPNDLISDAKGGLYFTDPWGGKENDLLKNEQPGTAVYYRNPQGELIRVTEWNDLGFPNGCVLSPDGSKFFLDDSESTTILVYDVNSDGTLSNKRVFAELRVNEDELEEGKEWFGGDGMTIDIEGNLYVASLTSLGIQVFNNNGEFLGNIQFPKNTSNCVFGGDDMSKLYVTTRAPGIIYCIQTKMKGVQYPMR